MAIVNEIESTTPYNTLDNILNLNIDSSSDAYVLQDVIKYPSTYTFSIWYRTENDSQITFNILGEAEVVDSSIMWKKYVKTITIETLDDASIYIIPSVGINSYFYEGYLVEGISDTSWLPAPEDFEDNIGSVRSEFTQTVNSIIATISASDGKITSLSTTIEGISAEISDAKGSSSTLKARLEGMEATVTDKEKNLQSQITQNADNIKLKVSEEEMNSAIETKSNEINLSVSKKKDSTSTAIRYIRDWLNGNSIDSTNRWVECQVIVGETNIAAGVTPVCYNKSLSENTISNTNVYTDELLLDIDGALSEQYIETSEESCLQIDLGEVRYDIDSIHVWHYYLDNRVYNHRLQISTDGISWVTLYDSNISGGYLESQDGKKYYISDNAIDSEMASLKLDVDSVSMHVTDLSGNVSAFIEKSDQISTTVSNLQNENDLIDERILSLVKQINEYNSSYNQTITQIQQNLSNIISRVASVEENGVMKDSTIIQDASGWKALFAELGMYDMENVQTYVTMDIHGMTIENKAVGKKTVITTEEFAGYYSNDKVFYLDEYGCLTKRIYIEKGWDTGIIKMTTASYPNSLGENINGVAYVVSGGKS